MSHSSTGWGLLVGERCPVLPRYRAGGICVWKPSSGVRKGFHPAHLGPGVQVATLLLSSTCDRWPLAPPGPGPEQGQVSPPARGSQLTPWVQELADGWRIPELGTSRVWAPIPALPKQGSPTFWARGLCSQEVEGTPARCLGLMSLPFASGMGRVVGEEAYLVGLGQQQPQPGDWMQFPVVLPSPSIPHPPPACM